LVVVVDRLMLVGKGLPFVVLVRHVLLQMLVMVLVDGRPLLLFLVDRGLLLVLLVL
jgi:hypothetical protein